MMIEMMIVQDNAIEMVEQWENGNCTKVMDEIYSMHLHDALLTVITLYHHFNKSDLRKFSAMSNNRWVPKGDPARKRGNIKREYTPA
jgi:hypothetical protein